MNADLTHVCGRCHKVVPPGEGYLGVRHGDIVRAQSAEADWRERYPGNCHALEELLEMPDEVRWDIYHFACDPRPEDGYQIGTEQIVTWAALTWWTSHLMRKTWLPLTDWDELMREVADGTGTRIIPSRKAA